jgi:hypothetical protein
MGVRVPVRVAPQAPAAAAREPLVLPRLRAWTAVPRTLPRLRAPMAVEKLELMVAPLRLMVVVTRAAQARAAPARRVRAAALRRWAR